MDGNDNKEEKTREVANNRMYHFGCNKDVICCDEWVMLVDIKVFHSFNMSDKLRQNVNGDKSAKIVKIDKKW